MEMSEGSILYSPDSLKSIFTELEKIDDFTLVPLLDSVATICLNDLSNNTKKYGVTDMLYVSDRTRTNYHLVIRGKIVSLELQKEDIDVSQDEDEQWWMTSGIWIEARDGRGNGLLRKLMEFTGEQNLGNLLASAATELKKGKVYHLTRLMRDFYRV